MNLKLEIRRNADGVIATDVWHNWIFDVFTWKHGNFSCDCNREDFFLGIDGGMESECSQGRYSVRCTDADTLEVLYDEFEQAPEAND